MLALFAIRYVQFAKPICISSNLFLDRNDLALITKRNTMILCIKYSCYYILKIFISCVRQTKVKQYIYKTKNSYSKYYFHHWFLPNIDFRYSVQAGGTKHVYMYARKTRESMKG